VRAWLGLLLLAACATTEPAAPAGPTAAVASPELRPCPPPVPPPKVPPVPRTVEQLADYANAEAKARWQTAARLRSCAQQVERAITWSDRIMGWLTLGEDAPAPPP
jgi:hypothetical protein